MINMDIDADDYKVVINSDNNFRQIANHITVFGFVSFPWTEGAHTQFDISLGREMAHAQSFDLALAPFQRGMKPRALVVSIHGIGVQHFNVIKNEPVGAHYVGEKFGLHPQSITTLELARLINGVIGFLT